MAQIIRRKFTAKNYPKGSPERERLNHDAVTSEYLPSYKYVVIFDDGFRNTYTTKSEATRAVENKK